MKLDLRTIDAKCDWKKIVSDSESSTRQSMIESQNIKEHPLYPCYMCNGYELRCFDYRVRK